MDYDSFKNYDQFFDFYKFQEQFSLYDDESFLINDENKDDLGLLALFKENFIYPPDDIGNKKKPNLISFKFISHCFFNPILKDNKEIMNNNQRKKTNNLNKFKNSL